MKHIEKLIQSAAGDGDILLVMPPFGSLYDVSLSLHTLQAVTRDNGFKIDILYLNILMASILGQEEYENVLSFPKHLMIGERLFSRSAYGLPPLGLNIENCTDDSLATWGDNKRDTHLSPIKTHFDTEKFMRLETGCYRFIKESARVISALGYKIIGCTMLMDQVNASIAFLNHVKTFAPHTLTIVGGGHCEGPLGEGILSLSQAIDYVFSGESEHSFPSFLKKFSNRKLPPQKTIVESKPLEHLDHLPLPDYSSFFLQHKLFLGELSQQQKKIWYETSRGCWWADAVKCTYCGIRHLPFREKSAAKVTGDLEKIKSFAPGNTIYMSDCVMPRSYHKDLLPEITGKDKYPPIAYMVRPNLKLQDLVELKKANINIALPGIESFSPNHLKLMHKGISGKQNILFLRHAKSVGILSDWLMLYGFPGDNASDYRELLELIPLLRHLQPPRNCYPVLMLRFSPYMDHPEKFQITNVTHPAVLDYVYPDTADKEKLAVYYVAEYPTAVREHKNLIHELNREIGIWNDKWKKTTLAMGAMMGAFIIHDNRDIHDKEKNHVLDFEKARTIMTSQKYNGSEYLQWALREKLGVVMESWYIPLVTASEELLLKFEAHKPATTS